METKHKIWAAVGVVAVLAGGYWLFSGGENPERDLMSTDQDRRLLAIEMLERKDSPAAARVIQQYMTDADIQVARRSIYAMARMPNAGSTEKLVEAVSHSRPEIREAAVVAMAMRKDEASMAAMRDRLQRDPSMTVRAAAAAELGAIKDPASIPLLVAAMESKDEALSNIAIRALLDMGGRGHVGFKPGATPIQRAEAIRALKRDAASFKDIILQHKKDQEILRR